MDDVLGYPGAKGDHLPNLQEYYRDLLDWEGIPYCDLVHPWEVDLQDKIEVGFEAAVSASGLKGSTCKVMKKGNKEPTNQSIGNQVEVYAAEMLSKAIRGFTLSPCKGAGYPDRVLVQDVSRLRIPLELKATSDWDPSDSNRRVLTSSSAKLRSKFSPPIHHLLLTVMYTLGAGFVTVEKIRLDFIEPSTEVKVRLEASVNHKILANGPHRNATI